MSPETETFMVAAYPATYRAIGILKRGYRGNHELVGELLLTQLEREAKGCSDSLLKQRIKALFLVLKFTLEESPVVCHTQYAHGKIVGKEWTFSPKLSTGFSNIVERARMRLRQVALLRATE